MVTAGAGPGAGVVSRVPGLAWASALLLAVAFAYGYADVWAVMVHQWSTNDAFSHGFLVPAISLYLAWQQRGKLVRRLLEPSLAAGLAALLAGLSMLAVGRAVGIVGVQELSMIVTVAGLILLVGGRGALRVLWLPTVYLVLMMPVWDLATVRLQYPMQLLAAVLGTAMMRLAGVPVLRDATILQLPNITLEVASICSGVNYLVAVIAVGLPVAYLSLRRYRLRFLLLAIAVGVAILSNSVRVALIGVLAYHRLSTNVHGPWHVLQGLFVSGVGYVAIFLTAWWLSHRERPVVHGTAGGGADEPPESNAGHWRLSGRALAAWGLAAVLLVAGGASRIGPVSDRWTAGEWAPPAEAGDFTLSGRGTPYLPSGQAIAWPDGPWWRFESRTGGVVHVFAGDYGSPTSAGRAVRYVSDSLEPFASRVAAGAGDSQAPAVKHVTLREDSIVVEVAYWYELAGIPTTLRIRAKVVSAWAHLTGRSDVPRVFLLVADGPSSDRGRGARSAVLALAGSLTADSGAGASR